MRSKLLAGVTALVMSLALLPQGARAQIDSHTTVSVWGLDSGTGLLCIVGLTPTCQLPTTGSGGGGGGNVNLIQVAGASINLGSDISANSLPVVIASDQGTIPVVISGPLGAHTQGASVSVTDFSMAPSTVTPCATATTAACTLTQLVQLLIQQAQVGSGVVGASGVGTGAIIMGAQDSVTGTTLDRLIVDNASSGLKVFIAGGTVIESNLPATVDTGAGASSASTIRVINSTDSSVKTPISPLGTNPTSTLTLPATTTAYAAGSLMASSATAGSVVVPSFAIATSAGSAAIPRLRLTTNDATSTAWGGAGVAIDLWSAAPTFTNGDRGVFLPATGVAGHLGTYTCAFSAEYGDGAYSECSPSTGNFILPKLASGTSIFWTARTTSVSGVTGASKVFTLTAELMN